MYGGYPPNFSQPYFIPVPMPGTPPVGDKPMGLKEYRKFYKQMAKDLKEQEDAAKGKDKKDDKKDDKSKGITLEKYVWTSACLLLFGPIVGLTMCTVFLMWLRALSNMLK